MAIIRTMIPSDYSVVAKMADDAARRALVGRPVWETAADVAAEVAALPQAKFLVAVENDGTVLGISGYRLTSQGEAQIYGPLMTPEGHGKGTWLFSRVEAMAENQGATSYSMLIGCENPSGAAWAKWRGYLRDDEWPEMLLMWLNPDSLQVPAAQKPGTIRQALPGDLDQITTLWHDCYFAHPLSQEEAAKRLDQYWVLEHQDQVQAFLQLKPQRAWLEALCVAPGLRRQGLGTRLAVEVLSQFRRKVGTAVRLENGAGVGLCRKLGFAREIPVARWVKKVG